VPLATLEDDALDIGSSTSMSSLSLGPLSSSLSVAFFGAFFLGAVVLMAAAVFFAGAFVVVFAGAFPFDAAYTHRISMGRT
jgi:hypothetical protein